MQKHWLMLLRTPGVGSKTFLKCLEHYSPEALFSVSREALLQLGLSTKIINALKTPRWDLIEIDLNWLAQKGNYAILWGDPNYPQQLKEIADPPPIIFARGDIDLIHFPQIAIVGSRNPSSSGLQIAYEFAQSLAGSGFTITSGLALGIDAASHRGALSVQGATVAVTGTGLDRVYPAAHKDLATEIVSTGVILSEFPPGTLAKANHFPRRNRIISGLCMGLLVVEAAKKSGSLITARMALEQNREVFAIPGSIYNPLARGCNSLIREGAKLVETTQDILEELAPHINDRPLPQAITKNTATNDLTPEQQNLLNHIQFSPTLIDQLVLTTKLTVDNISSHLLILELQGYISLTHGGGYQRNR
jgi:DNA processing protein